MIAALRTKLKLPRRFRDFLTESDPRDPVAEISMICVGTPGCATGQVDLSSVEVVCGQIARTLATSTLRQRIVIRSTVPPGTAERCARLMAEWSGRTSPADFAVQPIS